MYTRATYPSVDAISTAMFEKSRENFAIAATDSNSAAFAFNVLLFAGLETAPNPANSSFAGGAGVWVGQQLSFECFSLLQPTWVQVCRSHRMLPPLPDGGDVHVPLLDLKPQRAGLAVLVDDRALGAASSPPNPSNVSPSAFTGGAAVLFTQCPLAFCANGILLC